MLNAERTCLVLIDVQEKLAPLMAESESVVKNCGILLQTARALDLPILWCQQYPQAIGQTVEPLRPYLEGLEPMDKFSFSCCGTVGFGQRLDQLKVETTVLCGIETHVCVFQTAMELMQKGMYVHVIADAVSSRTAANKQIGLNRMAASGAVISATEMLLFELLRTARHAQFKTLSRLIR